jgi:hypothetical protein
LVTVHKAVLSPHLHGREDWIIKDNDKSGIIAAEFYKTNEPLHIFVTYAARPGERCRDEARTDTGTCQQSTQLLGNLYLHHTILSIPRKPGSDPVLKAPHVVA